MIMLEKGAVMSSHFKLIKQIILGLTLALMVWSGAALAADNTAQGPLTMPADSEQATTQAQRITARQAAFKTQIAAIDKAKISAKCTLAQSVVNSVKSQDATAYSTRLATYSDLADRLADAITKLKSQGIVVNDLNTAAANFYKSINTYLADHANYKAAIDDAASISCTSDPAGFELSILDARQLRAKMATDAAAVKSDVGPLVSAIASTKQQLAAESGGQQ